MFKRSIVAALSFSVLAGATAVPAQAAWARVDGEYCIIEYSWRDESVVKWAGIPYVDGSVPMETAVKRQKQFAEVERRLAEKVNNPVGLTTEEKVNYQNMLQRAIQIRRVLGNCKIESEKPEIQPGPNRPSKPRPGNNSGTGTAPSGNAGNGQDASASTGSSDASGNLTPEGIATVIGSLVAGVVAIASALSALGIKMPAGGFQIPRLPF